MLFFYSIAGGRVRAMLVFLSVPVSSVMSRILGVVSSPNLPLPPLAGRIRATNDGHLFGGSDFHGIVMTHKFLAPDEPTPVGCAD